MANDYLYLILDSHNKSIKIGRSRNPRERLEQLQHSNPRPLTLYHVYPLMGDCEPTLHLYLQKRQPELHIQGEWYEFTPELMEEVSSYLYHSFCDIFMGGFGYLDIEVSDPAIAAMADLWYELFAKEQVISKEEE